MCVPTRHFLTTYTYCSHFQELVKKQICPSTYVTKSRAYRCTTTIKFTLIEYITVILFSTNYHHGWGVKAETLSNIMLINIIFIAARVGRNNVNIFLKFRGTRID